MALTIQDVSEIHKQLWSDRRVVDATFAGSAFIGLMRKADDLAYEGKHISLQYGKPQGRSRKFATAKDRNSKLKFADWFIQASDDFGYFTIADKLLRSNQNSKAFMVNLLERLSKGAVSSVNQNQAMLALGTGTHERGIIGSIAESGGNTTVTLATPSDVKFFEQGMYIPAGATATGALRDSGEAYQVIGVDINAGTVLLEGTAETTSSWADGDYLFQDGDALDGETVSAAEMPVYGARAWIPDTAPSGTFLGQDRTNFPVHLGGHRFTATGLGTTTIYSTVSQACAKMTRAGSIVQRSGIKPDTAFINGEDFGELLDEAEVATGSRGVSHKRMGNGVNIGYDAVRLQTALGPVDFMVDNNQKQGRVLLTCMDSWEYNTIGGGPSFADEDGHRFARIESAMEWESRLRVYPQIANDAPIGSANILLPS